MKTLALALIAALALVIAIPQMGSAQWRATAWTLDFKNDTDMCISLSVGADGDPPLYQRDVWARRSQHFDDNHTMFTIHAKVYEKTDCSGRFIADLSDKVHQLRNQQSPSLEAGRSSCGTASRRVMPRTIDELCSPLRTRASSGRVFLTV